MELLHVVLVSLSLTTVVSATDPCPSKDWTEMAPIKNMDTNKNETFCYLSPHEKVSFFDAIVYCEAIGKPGMFKTNLVTITSEEKAENLNLFIKQTVDDKHLTEIWASGNGYTKKWVWLPTMDEFDYTDWKLPKHNTAVEKSCLQVTVNPAGLNGTWTNTPCSRSSLAVCEYRVPEPMVPAAPAAPAPT
ncbi:hypothetical protein ScPMuIL_001002 [Solemya velum]